MTHEMSSYLEILTKQNNQPLQEIIDKSFKKEHSKQFINDILQEDISDLEPFLLEPLKPWQRHIYHPIDLAYNFLATQPTDWLNQFYDIFEDFIQSNEEEHLFGSERLKTLIAKTGGCVRIHFLEDMLLYPGLSTEDEVEIHLLRAKVLEQQKGFNPEIVARNINLKEDFHLLPAYLYLFRMISPAKGITSFFMEGDELGLQQSPASLNLNYVSTYLRQSLYNLLNEADTDSFKRFLSWRESLESEWIIELLERVLEHPGLSEIKQNYIKLRTDFISPDKARHQELLSNIAD